jgi:hypothetical protein
MEVGGPYIEYAKLKGFYWKNIKKGRRKKELITVSDNSK